MPEYPECEKLSAVYEERFAILDFLMWCEGEGIHLARYDEDRPRMVTVSESPDALVMRHFNIDSQKIEDERRAMLENLHAS